MSRSSQSCYVSTAFGDVRLIEFHDGHGSSYVRLEVPSSGSANMVAGEARRVARALIAIADAIDADRTAGE